MKFKLRNIFQRGSSLRWGGKRNGNNGGHKDSNGNVFLPSATTDYSDAPRRTPFGRNSTPSPPNNNNNNNGNSDIVDIRILQQQLDSIETVDLSSLSSISHDLPDMDLDEASESGSATAGLVGGKDKTTATTTTTGGGPVTLMEQAPSSSLPVAPSTPLQKKTSMVEPVVTCFVPSLSINKDQSQRFSMTQELSPGTKKLKLWNISLKNDSSVSLLTFDYSTSDKIIIKDNSQTVQGTIFVHSDTSFKICSIRPPHNVTSPSSKTAIQQQNNFYSWSKTDQIDSASHLYSMECISDKSKFIIDHVLMTPQKTPKVFSIKQQQHEGDTITAGRVTIVADTQTWELLVRPGMDPGLLLAFLSVLKHVWKDKY